MSNQTSDNNKRIAKNTFFLYLRMLFLMLISLFTSRIVLAQLGVADFGLYNVVGSLILIFTFVQGSLSSATSRFLAFEIGNGTKKSLNNTFCMTLNIHILFALLILIVSETIGLWYFYNKMVIPSNRFVAALIVYQLSNLNAILAVLILPYRSMIIAKEEMKAFAYISIVEAVVKLGIAFCLYVDGIDRLVLYGALLCTSQVLVNLVYFRYCLKNFEETSFHRYWNNRQFKDMFSFSGWSICSYLSSSFVSQTFNLMLNLFFGPTVNAARAVSYQIQGAINNFSVNFQMALNPQIIKNFASSNLQRVSELVSMSMKVSFSLLYILMTPVLINIDWILGIWLKEVPPDSNTFVTIIGVCTIFVGMSNPLAVVAEAANRLKFYNLVTMPFYLLTIPIAYFALKLGSPASSVFGITCITEFMGFFVKLFVAHKIAAVPIFKILVQFSRCMVCLVLAVLGGICVYTLQPSTFLCSFCLFVICFVLATIVVFAIVLQQSERKLLINKILRR